MKPKKNLYKHFSKQKRDWLEAFCDLHNRKFELIRTLAGCLAMTINLIVLLKVFGKI